jgi:hypothetical protein
MMTSRRHTAHTLPRNKVMVTSLHKIPRAKVMMALEISDLQSDRSRLAHPLLAVSNTDMKEDNLVPMTLATPKDTWDTSEVHDLMTEASLHLQSKYHTALTNLTMKGKNLKVHRWIQMHPRESVV